jgi:hypothetical protein
MLMLTECFPNSRFDRATESTLAVIALLAPDRIWKLLSLKLTITLLVPSEIVAAGMENVESAPVFVIVKLAESLLSENDIVAGETVKLTAALITAKDKIDANKNKLNSFDFILL